MNNLTYFIKKNQDKLSLFFIIFIFSIITILLIYINFTEGILGKSYRDVYYYLIGALRFSGVNIAGYSYINNLSPLIPFLTSILFRLGYVNVGSIFIVTAIFYFLGVIGFFKLLRLRFNNIFSIFGTLLYGGLSINLIWACNGTIDIPSVALTILTIYFTILAVNKNQKYFYLVIPLGVLAFFAKFTAALIFPLILFYILINLNSLIDIKNYLRRIFYGILIASAVALPFIIYNFINNFSFGFISQASEVSNERISTSHLSHVMLNNIYYYFIHLDRFIYNPQHLLSYIIIFIVVIGLIIIFYNFIKILIHEMNFLFSLSLGILLLMILLTFFTVGKFSFIYSEILVFVLCLAFGNIFNKILKYYNKNIIKYTDFNYDFLMFAWFFSYLIFYSAHIIKADRYFTSMAPAFAFFVTLSLLLILNNFRSFNIKFNIKLIVPVIFIIVLLISSFGYLTINKTDSLVNDEENMANWVMVNQSDYSQVNISADRGPIYTWYMHKEVKYMKNPYDGNVLNYNLQKDNITYYIGMNPQVNISNYQKIKQFNNVTLYEKINS